MSFTGFNAASQDSPVHAICYRGCSIIGARRCVSATSPCRGIERIALAIFYAAEQLGFSADDSAEGMTLAGTQAHLCLYLRNYPKTQAPALLRKPEKYQQALFIP